MGDYDGITELIPVVTTESGNQLCKTLLHQQIYWFKRGNKINTHIGNTAFDNECAAYRITNRASIPYLLDAEIINFDKKQWIVTTEARGERLLDIEKNINCETRNFIEKEILQFVSLLGQKKGSFFGSLSEDGPRFNSERNLIKRMIDMHAGCHSQELVSVLDILDAHDAFTVHPVLVHYDLWPGNIFYCSDSRTVTVIDLERSLYSDQCAEGASLLGVIDASVLERCLCAGNPARIAKMYAYRIVFLLERFNCCMEKEERQGISAQLDEAIDTLKKKIHVLEVK